MQPQNHFYQTLLHRHSQDESDIVEHCLLCFQNVHKQEDIFHYVKRSSFLCGACRKQLEPLCKSTKLDSLQLSMLYRYNDFLESMIFQFKEGRDIALRPVFFHEVMQELNDKFRQYAIVLMPSSKEKMLERGFLPVREMLQACKLEIIEPFYKTSNHKQSLQNMQNRALISQVIQRRSDVSLPQKPLLLVDDVCTSGSTILCAYRKLLPHTYKIEALVLAAHPLFVESCDEKGLLKRMRFSIL
ncbi:MAG: ComF family protein [Longicatena caecimuris]|uniref:ComF family protein n=1 Tax=Longicatena caecimuris TaxID=1796635 RepID=UPI00399A71A5